MNVRLTFSEWLGDRLAENHLKAGGLARKLGVGRNTARAWVTGGHTPQRRTCRDIALALDLDVNEVLVRAGHPSDTPGYVLPEDREPAPDDDRLDVDLNLEAALLREGIAPDDLDLAMQIIRAMIRDKQP